MVKKSKGNSYWYILILILILICLFGGIFTYYFKSMLVEKFFSSSVKIEYYYMDNCGHCKSFEKPWKDFTDYVDKNSPNYSYVKYNILKGDGQERANKYNITGTPTVIATNNDKLLNTLESNKRSMDDLINFANTNSSV